MSVLWYAIEPNGMIHFLNNATEGWYFLEESGTGYPALALVSGRVPYQHGSKIRGVQALPREVGLILGFYWPNASERAALLAIRMAALSPFNADEVVDSDDLYTLRKVTEDGRTRDVKGEFVTIEDRIEGASRMFGKVTHIFVTEDSFFFDPTEKSEALSLPDEGGFSIPLSVDVSVVATDIDGYVYVDNQGDVEAWPTIRITGPCDNPVITNDESGKLVDLTQAMDAGDYIEIDMEEATVIWYDAGTATSTNIIETMSAASEFWSLVRGSNTLHVEAENAVGGTITISWHERFLSA